jgi:hypothetical protein
VDRVGQPFDAVSLSARSARRQQRLGKGRGGHYSAVNYANQTIVQIHMDVANPLVTNSSRVSSKSRMTEGHIFSETEAGRRSVSLGARGVTVAQQGPEV